MSKKIVYTSVSGSFKLLTNFINFSLEEIKSTITDFSKVKDIVENGNKITIVWKSEVEWASQPLEYLGYQVFPRIELLGQDATPNSYRLNT